MKDWFIFFITKFVACTIIYAGIFFVVVLCTEKTTWQEYFIEVLGLSVITTLVWEISDLINIVLINIIK